MPSVVSICNRALSRIGHTVLISSINDETTEAEQCDLHFEECRDEVLEAHDHWDFATKRVVLAELSLVERTDWEYIYTYPSDCLKARLIVLPGDRNPSMSLRQEFQVEANDDDNGKIILTDVEDAELLYTVRHETPGVWPSHFANAVSWRLAIELALGLKKDPALAKGAGAAYATALGAAATSTAGQGQQPTTQSTPSMMARRR